MVTMAVLLLIVISSRQLLDGLYKLHLRGVPNDALKIHKTKYIKFDINTIHKNNNIQYINI